jgi:phage protein D
MKPEFAVTLDGTKLTGETAAAIIGIRVFQTRFGASAFELVVSDQDLKWQGKPTFAECKEVKIELGVPGKLKNVFDGEVTAWRTELERSGPTVLVVRGMDRSHRLMRGHKTVTYQNATPIDVAKKIAGLHGLTAKTNAGSPAPVKMFRFQANETDFEFLRKMADAEGYMFWVEGKELHFERPQLSSTDDCEFTFGESLKTFLPSANFRKPAASVEVSSWDNGGKAEITGKAKKGDELWTVPGGKAGSEVSKFTSTKSALSIVATMVGTKEHADTYAKAALTRRAMEFLTGEVEVQGNPVVKPGAMVNLKKVGAYSGHYLVIEANHFYDAAGYNCIFYVARDKWGNSSVEKEKKKKGPKGGKGTGGGPTTGPGGKGKGGKEQLSYIEFTVQDDQGKALADLQVKVHLGSGESIEATTDGSGHVKIDQKPEGSYTVEILGAGGTLTFINLQVEDAEGNPIPGATGSVKLSDGSEVHVMTDVLGEVNLTDVPKGAYTFKLDEIPAGTGKKPGGGPGPQDPAGTT